MIEQANFRIRKYSKGWVVEIKKPRWTLFGIRWKWAHCISVAGINDIPWYYKTREFAEKEALRYIKYSMIEQARS
tara:strand:+ start:1640 stop:1864 length:225 start_codon:yes stop_codon:yes gene_type:complete